MELTSASGRLRPHATTAFKAAVALLVVVLTLQARAASASTSVSTFADREASAVLVSNARGLHTSVDIVVLETERTSAAGVDRHLNASIEIFQSDSRRPNAQQIDVAGGVEAELGALQMNGDLTAASVELTIPVCGAKVLHSGRLKARPFSECFDAKVDLRWTGTGGLVIQGGPSDTTVDGCAVHLESTSQRRTASAEGSVVAGGVNLAPNATSNAALSTFSETSTVTCP
jgi:hypothetical protein